MVVSDHLVPKIIRGGIEYKNVVTETEVCLPSPPASGRADEIGSQIISAVEEKRILFIIGLVEEEGEEFILRKECSSSSQAARICSANKVVCRWNYLPQTYEGVEGRRTIDASCQNRYAPFRRRTFVASF